jgi:hypothetical protein
MSEWQPISTAPKDKDILLSCYYPGWGYEPPSSHVAIGFWGNSYGKGCWVNESHYPFESTTPTHWMPLPEPHNGD